MYKEGFGNIPNKDKIRYMLDLAFNNTPGRWVVHSYIIGKTSEKIAKEIGLDPDVAFACGALHDIGKGYGNEAMAHMIEGYRILRFDSYFFPAKIALGHGFVLNDINSYHGRVNVTDRDYEFIEKFLSKREMSPYEKLVITLDNLINYDYVGFDKRESQRIGVDIDNPIRLKRRHILDIYKEELESKLKEPIKDYMPQARYYKFPYNLLRDKK